MATTKQLVFPPWFGEFGWEVMTYAPWCRAQCLDADKRGLIRSFLGMTPLYDDFADFKAHTNGETRSDTFSPKRYRVDRIHRKYGNPNPKYEILIHARGIRRKAAYNYKQWADVVSSVYPKNAIAAVGSEHDQHIEGVADERGIPLQDLMDLMAGARLVVGVSSGVMHLAAACGTPVVVWGYSKTHFGETLEKRYKETWNPHSVRVEWVTADDFQPTPNSVLMAIEKLL